MRIIVGHGNDETKYDRTRHNLGFMVLDNYADKYELNFKKSAKFQCHLVETLVDDEKVILAKPTTMMNLSGHTVQALQKFYKFAPEDVLVIHDEIDLEFKQIRVKRGGGTAGHNGLKSITSVLGEDYWRVRIGIGNEKRDLMDAADFVLARFDQAEVSELDHIIKHSVQAVEDFLDGKFDKYKIT